MNQILDVLKLRMVTASSVLAFKVRERNFNGRYIVEFVVR